LHPGGYDTHLACIVHGATSSQWFQNQKSRVIDFTLRQKICIACNPERKSVNQTDAVTIPIAHSIEFHITGALRNDF